MDRDLALPSSPPHASTPSLPGTPFFEPYYTAHDAKSSSPPPSFSSDDSDESADIANYESPRIYKHKRRGAWWDTGESAHSTPAAKKARVARNSDSGVYLMSDGTASSDSLLPRHTPPFGLHGAWPRPQVSRGEAAFCSQLSAGLENNADTYTLTNLDLCDSDIRRIGELASVIKNTPDPGNELPAEGQYRSLVAQLYVNLSHNRLRRLTPSLFELQNLTALILVDNDIDELPPHIGQLRSLTELNISRNKLQWLPFECLALFHGLLDIVGDSGVPWLQLPDDLDEHAVYPHHPPPRHLENRPTPRYLARTPVSFFDQTGGLIKVPPWSTPAHAQTVSSLVAMSVHNALRHRHHEQLTIPDLRRRIGDPVPRDVDAMLTRAADNSLGGYSEFRKCHVCSNEYVVARAEWIEWWSPWSCAVFPLKVRVCSWRCVPDVMLRRPAKERGCHS